MNGEGSPAPGQLLSDLRSIIARLRQDVEARSDPALEEIANALDVISELSTRSCDRAETEGRGEKGTSRACNG